MHLAARFDHPNTASAGAARVDAQDDSDDLRSFFQRARVPPSYQPRRSYKLRGRVERPEAHLHVVEARSPSTCSGGLSH